MLLIYRPEYKCHIGDGKRFCNDHCSSILTYYLSQLRTDFTMPKEKKKKERTAILQVPKNAISSVLYSIWRACQRRVI